MNSMNEKLLDILKPQGECIGEETLIRYAKGGLSAEDARRVEEHLTECELCSDALDGIMKSGDVGHYRAKVSHAKKSLQHKLRGVEERSMFPFTRALAIAATVMLLVVSAWFVQYLMNNESQRIFSNEFKPYPAAPIDSVIHQELIPAVSETYQSQNVDSAVTDSKIKPQKKKTELRNEPEAAQTKTESSSEVSTLSESKSVEAAPADNTDVVKDEELSDKNVVAPQAAGNNSASFTEKSRMAPAQKMDVYDSTSLPQENSSRQLINDQLNHAIDLYQDQKYNDAITEFNVVLKSDPSNATANFYSGVSALAVNNADEALGYFKKTDNKSNRYYEATLWYQALAYLKKDQKKEAKNLLEKVVKQNGEHKSQAEELLKSL